jgi:hypothetical protein
MVLGIVVGAFVVSVFAPPNRGSDYGQGYGFLWCPGWFVAIALNFIIGLVIYTIDKTIAKSIGKDFFLPNLAYMVAGSVTGILINVVIGLAYTGVIL